MNDELRPAVEVTDLTVAYRDRPVLWDIDLEVPAGKLMAIMGPNGAGKTTLIKAILGLVPAAAGQVLIHGRPYAEQRRLHEAARSLGCAVDDPFMPLSFLSLTVIPKLKLSDLGLVDVERGARPLAVHPGVALYLEARLADAHLPADDTGLDLLFRDHGGIGAHQQLLIAAPETACGQVAEQIVATGIGDKDKRVNINTGVDIGTQRIGAPH